MLRKYIYGLLIGLSLVGAVLLPKVGYTQSDRCVYHPETYEGLVMEQLSQELNDTGLIGRIHGAAAESQMFVLSVREPTNFFGHREFSLLPQDAATQELLNTANRHDLVCVSGAIISNPSPQQHIAVREINILEPWQQPKGFTSYQRSSDIPEQLKAQTSLTGKVHATSEDGKVLVLEYGDGVIPVFVTTNEYTRELYRGDIVKVAYQIQTRPQQPLHLQLDTSVAQPLEVIDAIAFWHDKPTTLRGKLVKFPQSPQLKFDVYAMEVDTQGIKRYFTLINFENMTEFENIRQKLAQIWDDNLDTAQTGRNMLINPQVTIEAQGLANIISSQQANPQILLNSAEDVRLAMDS